MITLTDLHALHADSIHAASAYVSWVRPRDLARPTPCRGWKLSHLLAHMLGQNLGFAKAVREGRATTDDHLPRHFTPEAWRHSTHTLLAAFRAADPTLRVVEPELVHDGSLPLHSVLGAQLLDTVVHTWDVARSLELQFNPTREIASAVLAVASTVPDGPARRRAGSPFRPAQSMPVGASDWERSLALLGRDPHS